MSVLVVGRGEDAGEVLSAADRVRAGVVVVASDSLHSIDDVAPRRAHPGRRGVVLPGGHASHEDISSAYGEKYPRGHARHRALPAEPA